MSTFNDQFLLAMLNHEEYQAQQLLGTQLLHAQAAQLELGSNTTAAAIKHPFDPVVHDLVKCIRIRVTCNWKLVFHI
jgi:hypothetical protein